VSEVAGDWRYSEFAEGGFVTRIGLDDPAAAEAAAASAAASAASGGGVAASAP
jgi:penicillin-binding protein 1A